MIVFDALIVRQPNASNSSANIDMRLCAEAFEFALDSRVLAKRLDECAQSILRRQVRLFLELLESPRRKARLDPRPVSRELKFWIADQKIVGAETVERRKPRFRRSQVSPEFFDVR